MTMNLAVDKEALKKVEKEESQYKGRFFLGDKIIDKSGVSKTTKAGVIGGSFKGVSNTHRTIINSSKDQFMNVSGSNFKNNNSGKLYNNAKSRLTKTSGEAKH